MFPVYMTFWEGTKLVFATSWEEPGCTGYFRGCQTVLCGYVGEDVCITDLCICNSLCISHKELILLLFKQGWFLSFDKYSGYIRWQYEEKQEKCSEIFHTLLNLKFLKTIHLYLPHWGHIIFILFLFFLDRVSALAVLDLDSIGQVNLRFVFSLPLLPLKPWD